MDSTNCVNGVNGQAKASRQARPQQKQGDYIGRDYGPDVLRAMRTIEAAGKNAADSVAMYLMRNLRARQLNVMGYRRSAEQSLSLLIGDEQLAPWESLDKPPGDVFGELYDDGAGRPVWLSQPLDLHLDDLREIVKYCDCNRLDVRLTGRAAPADPLACFAVFYSQRPEFGRAGASKA